MDVILLASFVIGASSILVLLLMVGAGELLYFLSDGKIFKKLYHDRLGIHLPSKVNDSYSTICKICGKRMVFYDDTWVA